MNVINIQELGNINESNISTTGRTINGIGLCYFDPKEEVLKEFTSDITIPVFPMEESTRQFYIVKDDPNLKINTITFKAFGNSSNYEIKSSLNVSEDYASINVNNELLIFLSNYNNLIPINIYIRNTRYTVEDLMLNISMDVN